MNEQDISNVQITVAEQERQIRDVQYRVQTLETRIATIQRVIDETLEMAVQQRIQKAIPLQEERNRNMSSEQQQQNDTQFIECGQCGKPVFLESTPQDDDLQTRHYYTCSFCGYSDLDVPVA